MIRLENVSYKVGNKFLLDNISVSFEPGKLNLIIGPNGAGKSTLVKAICNQLKLTEGSIFYNNKNIKSYSDLELAKIRSVLSQSVDLTFPLKVWELVMMGRYPHFSAEPTSKDEIACEEALRFFDVLDFADRNYMTLSGGEKQRVNFARVLAQIWYPNKDDFRYLILDEPLTFLDVHYQFQFMQQMLELLKDEKLVIIGVVHDLNLAAKFADYLVLLHNAKLLSTGDKHEVLTKENIKKAYQLEPVFYKENGGFYLFFD